MTIKGTLETFNLLDLLQMLAFNQKVGTLVLETVEGPRTLFVEGGSFGFVQGDPVPSRAFARVLRRGGIVPPERLERGLNITANSGKFLGDVLSDLGVLDQDRRGGTWREAVQELFFDLLQTPITRFEFVEGQRLAPNGVAGEAIQPLCAVDGVLLELTRRLDEWSLLREEIGGPDEVYEIIGHSPDVLEAARASDPFAERVLPLIDGRRTIQALVDESDCDRFAVAKLLSALMKQGTLQRVPTDSMLARAEEALSRGAGENAVPLLRKAIERGEAPAKSRVRLADALEAAGDAEEAASELDTYATAEEGNDPGGAFEALRRAMLLRGGDAPTAARVCDLWLRHRARLHGRAQEGVDALRRLVHAATAGGRPLDAAERLAAFLDAGEAAPEDRLVLADLYASGSRPADAAQALIRRAEDLLVQGRVAAARDLLRRAVAYDSTRADARRRIDEIENRARRRTHKRRVVVMLMLAVLVAATASVAYLVLDGRAARTMEAALGRADSATKDAEREMQAAQAAWNQAVTAACSATGIDAALLPAATQFRADADRITGGLKSAIQQAQAEMGGAAGTLSGDAATTRVAGLEARQRSLLGRFENAMREVSERADRALQSGEKAFAEGHFREARPLLVQAVNLSYDDPARASKARQRLEHVDAYLESFARARQDFDALAAKGDTEGAWRAGARLFARFLDSDLTRELLLPVPVTSEPTGAQVRLGRVSAVATPVVLRYSPFGDLEVLLRAPGRTPRVVRLPSYKDVFEAEKAGGSTPFRIDATLPEGPRWVKMPPGGLTAGPFAAGDMPFVVGDDGRRVLAVRPDGEMVEVRTLGRRSERVRLAGRTGGGTWVIQGQRTFSFVPESGAPGWSVQTVGRLEVPPAVENGMVLLVDETGGCYGADVETGEVKWRRSLSFAPIQAPYATAIGFVVTTLGGEAVALDAASGESRALVPPDPTSPVFLGPWRDGVAILGGGGPGLAMLSPSRERTEIGAAAPEFSVRPAAFAQGIAWIEKDGRARWLGKDATKPVRLDGLGTPAMRVVVADDSAYAVGKDGVMRAVRLASPGFPTWTSRLPSPARSDPVVYGDAVLVATDAGLCAFDR